METLFEGFMLIAFIIGICSMIYCFALNKTMTPLLDRGISITMGVGFVIGAVNRAMTAPVKWTFVLYILGAMLSYTAILFSFPGVRKHAITHYE